MEFSIPREPDLLPRYFMPHYRQTELPAPVEGRRISYHFWARNALFRGLEILGIQSDDKILLPAFHCRTVVEPIIRYGCQIVFYNIRRDGGVDFDDLVHKVDRHTKALLAIHYFGTVQPVRQLQAFCRQHGLFLIEDCAHILRGEIEGEPLGSFGDVSIFSWRKFFPLYDGGLLVQNHTFENGSIERWKAIDGRFQLKILKNLLEKSWKDRRGRTDLESLPSRSPVLPPGSNRMGKEPDSPHLTSQASGSDFDDLQVDWPMSRWSKVILKNVNIPWVVRKRHEHDLSFLKACQQWSEVYPWAMDQVANVCAWAFPLLVPKHRDIHVQLRERGIEAFTWGGVIHPSLPLEEYPDAKFLYEHLVLLPNQQSLTEHEMAFMIESVQEVLREHTCNHSKILQ